TLPRLRRISSSWSRLVTRSGVRVNGTASDMAVAASVHWEIMFIIGDRRQGLKRRAAARSPRPCGGEGVKKPPHPQPLSPTGARGAIRTMPSGEPAVILYHEGCPSREGGGSTRARA